MNTPGVSIITATGCRPETLELCGEFIARQDYEGPLQWVIVDDGEIVTGIETPREGVLLTHIYPTPAWKPGDNTLARNLLAALSEVQHDFIVFMEDDDWYSPQYIAAQVRYLAEGFKITGEVPAYYYHLPTRRYWALRNQAHASLCQTAIHREMLPTLQLICESPNTSQFIDVRLWEHITARRSFHGGRRVIGMKGLPGRPGIGVGHRPEVGGGWETDPDLRILTEWIGSEDVETYQRRFKTPPPSGGYLSLPPTPVTKPRASQTPKNCDLGGVSEEKGAPTPLPGDVGESGFQEFYFMGQLRYRCDQVWEGGAQCEYDTYDLQALYEHRRSPHTQDGKPSQSRVRVSPVVDSQGKAILIDETNRAAEAYRDLKFKE